MKPEDVPAEVWDAYTNPADTARERLAAALTVHERQVRERVAVEIRADHDLGRVVAPYERCVRVALDRDPDDWPTDEREVDALLDRIVRAES